MAGINVEELSNSLVREFLSRKGLRGTLAKLDEELPRSSESISNRLTLAKAVRIDKLMKKNKELATPYRTMIEVVVQYLISSHLENPTKDSKPITSSSKSTELRPTLSSECEFSKSNSFDSEMEQADMSSFMTSKKHAPGPLSGRGNITGGRPSSSISSGARKMGQRVIGSKPNKKILSSRIKGTQESLGVKNVNEFSAEYESKTSALYGTQNQSSVMSEVATDSSGSPPLTLRNPEVSTTPPRLSANRGPGSPGVHRSPMSWGDSEASGVVPTGLVSGSAGDDDVMLVCEDLEEFDMSITVPTSAALRSGGDVGAKKGLPQGKPIAAEQAKALRGILFGDTGGSGAGFNSEWRQQALTFSNVEGLEYGLVQHKGGPCGTLASLQAHIMKHLLFEDTSRSLSPNSQERNKALVSAIAEILWRAGGYNSATVALYSTRTGGKGHFRSTDVLDQLDVSVFSDKKQMILFLEAHIGQLMSASSCGCIVFTVSVILSRGIAQIRSDMDEPSSSLIGAHGYCTQELVNLILTGHAVSNVFDGVVNLETGADQKNVLRGIHERSDIGFLSLFEHYGSCQVGHYYKSPNLPIFVVCSESHFLVLFSTSKTLIQSKELQKCFDLFYYDGLANQKESIRLTIRSDHARTDRSVDSGLTPPIELCIKTRWRDSLIDWNGSEQLL